MLKSLADDPDGADLNSLTHRFNSLIVNPIKHDIDKDVKKFFIVSRPEG